MTELIVYLSEQKAILESVVSCLECEQEAIIKEDPDKLLVIIKHKTKYINELTLVEEKRNEAYPDMTLSQLDENGNATPELELIGDEMRVLVDDAQRLQRTNRMLTHRSREHAEKMIALLQGENKPTYNADGKRDGNKKANVILDSSV